MGREPPKGGVCTANAVPNKKNLWHDICTRKKIQKIFKKVLDNRRSNVYT